MRFVFFYSLVCCKVFASLPLLENYHKAKEMAALYEKPLVVIFTAEDHANALEELVGNKLFAEAIENEFIFVKIDLSDKQKEVLEHHMLKERWEICMFPTILLLDKEEREITRSSYRGQAPEKFAGFLKDRLATYQKLSFEYEKASTEKCLENLYEIAADLGSQFYRGKILEKGLATQEGVFFPLEQYTALVNRGEKNTPEAKGIREVILKRDPDNQKGARLRLALLDFQEGEGEPETVIAPLGAYITEFGSTDKENLWRLNLIISEYLSAHGKADAAKEYALRSLSEAPEQLKVEVSNLLTASR